MEDKLGSAGQFIYDLNCILDSRKRNYDIILQLGYTSSSIWTFLFPKSAILITNMDGLEWKRSKYSGLVRTFLKSAERWAALHSDYLIADSKGIQSYLWTKYKKPSEFIAYGATPIETPNEAVLKQYSVEKYKYNMLIARMEPENNIEVIIKGHLKAAHKVRLLIVGGLNNQYGKQLEEKYASDSIIFLGAIYDLNMLDSLRYHSNLYFHGHSVGGTNPSLLEAMSSNALIVANNNIFNRSVLEDDAFYFADENEVAAVLDMQLKKEDHLEKLRNNREKITHHYSWTQIVNQLESFFADVLRRKYGAKNVIT
jgi:glycosyltransferase involved in cell wall biosynthesis